MKNKREGERPIALTREVADRVQEYIDVNRVERAGSGDRRPLFTTEKGDTARDSVS